MSIDDLPYTADEAYQGGFERTPPQDIPAEQSVLGGMLLSKDAIAEVIEVIKATDFYKPAHEAVFGAILELYGRGEPADPVTVAALLTKRGDINRIGGAPYLHTLINSVPTAANAGYYAEIVKERAILRRLVEAGTRIVQMGYSTDGSDVEQIVDAAQQEMYNVTEARTSEDFIPLADAMEGALDEIESISNRSGQMTGVPTGFHDLDALTNGLHPGQMVIIAARPAIGKALALDTPLPTPNGWTTMGDVRVGDLLLGADGRPTRVVAATEVMTGRPCYEVEFSDGSVIVADAQHEWFTETRASRKAGRQVLVGAGGAQSPRISGSVSDSGSMKTTEEIARTLRCETADGRLNHSVPVAAAVELPEAELPLSPYALGVWLGDGHSDAARFTTADPEVAANLGEEGFVVTADGPLAYSLRFPTPGVAERSCAVCGAAFVAKTSQVRTCGKVCGGRARFISAPSGAPSCPDCGQPSSGVRRCQACHNAHGTYGTVQAVLRSMGVLGDKHIPAAYLRASVRQRRALLAGLLDAEGLVDRTGTVQFSVTNQRLAQGAHELILSLGYRATLATKRVASGSEAGSTAYTVTFTPADPVFRLTRKLARQTTRDHPTTARRYITGVRPIAT
ncbi:MAG: hypothetical protein JF587_08140, partial [Catenulisporales bacterium]|nr:hypothetical protein [Catenulisporales bacterium]